jgi:glycosyltransferase involved in cell wall biosynthesis
LQDLFQGEKMTVVSMFFKHREGGYNKRLYRMFKALAGQGHEVHYLACEQFPIEDPNIHFHLIPVPWREKQSILFWPLFSLMSPFAAFILCWKTGADRIAVFGSWYAALMVLPRFLLGCKISLFLRADSVVLYHIEKRSLPARMINQTLDFLGILIADEVWVNIGYVKSNIIKRYGIPEHKVRIIYNNIDELLISHESERARIREELGIEGETLAVCTSGIFYRRKNIEFLIKAFSMAFGNSVTKLVIIGDDVNQGSERKRLEDITRSLRMDDSVIFTGWRKDSRNIIGACDLYVIPTMHEGFPNALLDALSIGCPSLGSRIRELEEVLHYDDLLFSLEGYEELVRKLREFVDKPEYRRHIRVLSNERAEAFHFDWDKAVVDAVIS